MKRSVWYVLEAIIAREASEAAAYGLMEAGALGTETSADPATSVTVRGYFAESPDTAAVRAALEDALRIYNLAPTSLIDLKVSETADRDWLAEWKKDWQPVETGRFIIAPPWSEPPAVAGGPFDNRITIFIEPGMAFGTGTHETTRLCLKAIEKHFRGGSFLDVGTGTGILAIAAAKMFPDARVEACDTDAEAIEIARENARLNGVGDRIAFRVGTVDEETLSAHLVCANLTAPVIAELLPSLLGATCGRLVLSGILDSQIELVQSRLLELGATALKTDQDGEWVALDNLMTRRRFYAPPSAFAPDAQTVSLSADQARHARSVLRLQPGDEVYVFDGAGKEFRCAVREFVRDGAVLSVLEEVEPARPESPLDLGLAVALLKGEKFDLVVQKATELGASRIVPMATSRADVRIRSDDDAKRKVTRWQRIALEAAKQCGRARLMEIAEPVEFKALIDQPAEAGELHLMFAERNGTSLADITQNAPSDLGKVLALIGSEGGWAGEEIELARAAGWKIITLGGRTLRAETAAITIIALLQHRFGDLT